MHNITTKFYVKEDQKIEESFDSNKAVPNGDVVRDTILKQGMKANEASAYFWGNITKSVQDTSKGALTAHSGKRLATSGFKATK